mmetsp:Transcript_5559/g.13855  ORF Transcript_5559/g.13855 Transcript_5559/m.13855 type:complete len:98 (-) Transcript_5559:2245-2538(-)
MRSLQCTRNNSSVKEAQQTSEQQSLNQMPPITPPCTPFNCLALMIPPIALNPLHHPCSVDLGSSCVHLRTVPARRVMCCSNWCKGGVIFMGLTLVAG